MLTFVDVMIVEYSRYFVGVFNKTVIPLALVGYEMIIANSGYLPFISKVHSWNNCQLYRWRITQYTRQTVLPGVHVRG